MLLNLALMLMTQHWLEIVLGVVSMLLIDLDIQAADQDGIENYARRCRHAI